MHIVCPNCTTSYAVNPATFGDAGRTVRCARCKEVWLARPEDLSRAEARIPAMAAKASEPDPNEDMSAWGVTEDDDASAPNVPVVESPSISADWPTDANDRTETADWATLAQHDAVAAMRATPPSRFAALRRFVPSLPRLFVMPKHSLPIATATMASLLLALVIWRVDLVKLMPQTATFYQAVGLDVNVRGLAFKDVKVTTETVDGKSVLLIEGLIVSETRIPTALPRLRFVVRDEKGTEIYGWNAVLEQPGLNPGDKTWFRSRLASPPAEGRSIDVRFFTKRDVAGA
ncbi:MJ0042 family finger-like domain-containing protein [Tardiphaga sp. OK246]|uniref:MJ0042-type zinc finger domain-containing protein n=1 Tax=Tardiphaga sp. OK246 TaxID=1855307 RepID=UPI000B6B9749|nr:MJ0042 family finger-like domain-containing protein [Tardiphaga sp. OK246]